MDFKPSEQGIYQKQAKNVSEMWTSVISAGKSR